MYVNILGLKEKYVVDMRRLNDIVTESLLDDDDQIVNDGVKKTLLREVWEDLTKNWGEILMGSGRGAVTIDNIDFDSRGRIIFKNWPGSEIQLYLGSIGFVPDSFKKYGFGDLPSNVDKLIVKSFRGKLSDLSLNGNYKGKTLELEQGSYEMDRFPKFDNIYFNDSYFRNVGKMPKKQPMNCKILFSDSSVEHLFGSWSDYFFKGNYAQWTRGGQQIIT